MKPYIGVILYIIFIFWEMLLLWRYLKMIKTKRYEPRIKLNPEDEPLQIQYTPDEIAHMLSIEKGNYFSESMAKVDTVLLLQGFANGYLETKVGEAGRIRSLKIADGEVTKEASPNEQEIMYLFQTEQEKRAPEKLHIKDIKWKVFSYHDVRETAKAINERLKENLRKRKLLNKTAFENIDKISTEIFVNFILLFVAYGITYLSFIPTMVGMFLAAVFTICNMGLGFWAKKRISRYTKKGMDELAKIKMFGDALIDSMNEAEEDTKYQMVEQFYPYAYALGRNKEMLSLVDENMSKESYPFAYLLKNTNFLKEIKEIEKSNQFKLRKIY